MVQISTKSCNPHQTAITVTGSSHVIRGRSRSPGQSRVASNINMKMHIYIYTYNIPRSISDYILSLADSYSLILSTYTLTIIYTSTHLDMLYIYIHTIIYTNYTQIIHTKCNTTVVNSQDSSVSPQNRHDRTMPDATSSTAIEARPETGLPRRGRRRSKLAERVRGKFRNRKWQ